ncbi:MAG: cellobiose 2-epimerase [Acidobacteriota bacterium]
MMRNPTPALRPRLRVILASLSLLSPVVAAAPLAGRQDTAPPPRARLERILLENILPFWYPAVLDEVHGGYRLNHDLQGRWQGDGPKATVTQARTLWFFSRLLESPYARPEFRRAAEHGFQFLRDRLWDAQYGGFYWSVAADGTPLDDRKHLYAQAFALYGLSAYARVTGDVEARGLARRLFDLIEDRAYDSRFGGYRESFTRDWRPLEREEAGLLGPPENAKTMNTHLHLMEALTELLKLEDVPPVRRRLHELVLIETNTVIRKPFIQGTDIYRADWTPVLEGPGAMTSYGHDLENVWLVMEALETLGLPQHPLQEWYRAVWETALRYGYDRDRGGFWYRGPLGARATVLNKEWWVQAECLVSALRMYQLTGDARYREVFLDLLDWIEKKQVDWENGEWFANVDPDGSVRGGKAGPWKGPYHNARAVLECLKTLAGME